MRKKSKGSFTKELLGSIIFISIFVVGINYLPPLTQYINVLDMQRGYKMEMMKEGYLSYDSRQKLKNELTNIGCENISIVATDSKVKWGQDIKLIIEYDTKIKEAKVEDNNGFSIKITDKVKRIRVDDKKTISAAT
ncbi:hypothetical protein [Clostridium tertium]|uniref:hypothetical protein n=1 Tax=Clostridium tertium TaxID=1559 RepID=UPI002028CBBD|nr:hypothetical protein [Clostridium tertium]